MELTHQDIENIADSIALKVKESILTDQVQPKWLSMPAAIKYADVCKNTLKKWIREGYIYGSRPEGGDWKIDRESIDDFFNADRI